MKSTVDKEYSHYDFYGGEWFCFWDADDRLSVASSFGDSYYMPVCEISQFTDDNLTEATGRLIAASPNLYKALRRMVVRYGVHSNADVMFANKVLADADGLKGDLYD